MRHVSSHMSLHLHGHSLLQLELIQVLSSSLRHNFCSELFLKFEHFDHSGLVSLHHLDDLSSVFMEWKLRDQIKKSFIPVGEVRTARVYSWEGKLWITPTGVRFKTTDTQ